MVWASGRDQDTARQRYALPPEWGNTLRYQSQGGANPDDFTVNRRVQSLIWEGRSYSGGGNEVGIRNAPANILLVITDRADWSDECIMSVFC